MKTLSDKLFTLFIVLLGICDIYAGRPAGKGPPTPTARGAGTTGTDDFNLPPPGLPIDEHVFLLIGIAILFGIYIIYRNNLKTKSPI